MVQAIIYEIRMARAKYEYYKNKIRLLENIKNKKGSMSSCSESESGSLSSLSSSSRSSVCEESTSKSSKSFTSDHISYPNPNLASKDLKPETFEGLSPFDEGGIEYLRLSEGKGENENEGENESDDEREGKGSTNLKTSNAEWPWPVLAKEDLDAAIDSFFEVVLDSDPSHLDKNSFPTFMTFYNSQFALENSLPLNAIRPEDFSEVVSRILKTTT